MLKLIIMIGLWPLIKGQIEVQELKASGILFEPIRPAMIYQTRWTIVTRLTLLHPEDTINFIEKSETAANELCKIANKGKENCSNWHDQIYAMIEKIENQLGELGYYLGPATKNRRKRGLVDGVGKLSKFLFGTMDNTDAKHIYARLQTLEKHDNENLHLMQKQMTVLKSSFDVTSKHIQNLTFHQNHLYETVKSLTLKVGSETMRLKQDLADLHLLTEMNQILIFIWTKLQLIHDHINEQFTIINSLHQHTLHPLLISYKLFQKTYEEITNSTKGYLPLTQFSLLNQVIEVQSFKDNKGLIIKIMVPLILSEQYTLQKIHLIPVTNLGKQTTLLNVETGFILNGTQNQYLEMTQKEFNENCKLSHSDEHHFINICHQKQPKVLEYNKQVCLATLLHHELQLATEICSHKVLNKNLEFLVKLVRKDAWLFTFSIPHKIVAHCDKTTTMQELRNTGVLTLTEPCTFTLDSRELPFEGNNEVLLPLKQAEIKITPQFTFKTVVQDKLNNTQQLSNTNNFLPILQIQPYHNFNADLLAQGKNIEELNNELKGIDANRKLETQELQTDINSSLLVCLGLGILIWLLKQTYTKYVGSCSRKNRPEVVVLDRQSIEPTIELKEVQSEPKVDQKIEITPKLDTQTRKVSARKSFRLKF